VIKLLLKIGKINIDLKDYHKRTPLSWAAEGGRKTVVKMLLKIGKINIDLKDYRGQTPLS